MPGKPITRSTTSEPVTPSGTGTSEFAQRVQSMKNLCAEMIRNVPTWKDKESVRIDGPYRGKATTIILHDQTIAVMQYLANVNAKNSYGAYGGEKPAACYVDMGEIRVLDLRVF
jgi:hypothetical protein